MTHLPPIQIKTSHYINNTASDFLIKLYSSFPYKIKATTELSTFIKYITILKGEMTSEWERFT